MKTDPAVQAAAEFDKADAEAAREDAGEGKECLRCGNDDARDGVMCERCYALGRFN